MDDIKTKVANLRTSNVYINLTNYYSKKSLFSIIGDDRNEKVHSNFIAWILRPEESHGLGDYPLQEFLLLLSKAKGYERNRDAFLPENYERTFLIGNYKLHNAFVDREHNTGEVVSSSKKNNKGLIDILLELDITIDRERKILPIIIENKVGSKENDYRKTSGCMQTELYYKWGQEKQYTDKTKYFSPIYVFLTAKSTAAVQKEYININYQDVVDIVLSPCLAKKPTDDGEYNIKNYLRCLSYSNICEGEERDYIMAITDAEKKLLMEFYETNKPLLSAVAECLMTDEEVSEEEKAALDTFSKVVSRDYSKYSFAGKDNLSKRRTVLEVIKKYVEDHKGISLTDIQKAFPKSIQGTYEICEKRMTKDRNYFCAPEDVITLNDGTEMVVCNQWGLPNFTKFVEKAEEYGYSIEKTA